MLRQRDGRKGAPPGGGHGTTRGYVHSLYGHLRTLCQTADVPIYRPTSSGTGT